MKFMQLVVLKLLFCRDSNLTLLMYVRKFISHFFICINTLVFCLFVPLYDDTIVNMFVHLLPAV